MRAYVIFLSLVFSITFSHSSSAKKRIALLIGNAGYSGAFDALNNPHKDIALVKAALLKVGFKEENIVVARDAGPRKPQKLVNRHVRKLDEAGPDSIGFFYYSGHGAANDETRVNYLIPTDVTTNDSYELWEDSVKLQEVIDKLKTGAREATHFVIFDACRNTLRLKKPGTKSVAQSKGFVQIKKVNGMLIAFSTAEGDTASDGDEGGGPYALALSQELPRSGREAVTMFRRVQLAVRNKIGQEPWLTYGALPEFFFAGQYSKELAAQLNKAGGGKPGNRDEVIAALLARINSLQTQCIAQTQPLATGVAKTSALASPQGPTYALLNGLECISPRANKLLLATVRDGLKTDEAKEIMANKQRLTHFLTQILLETGGLRRIDENMNYSENSLLRVFSRKTISRNKAKELSNKPKEIANWVYGKKLGNRGRNSDDGWNYRGAGFLLIAGRLNYKRLGKELNLPLEQNPRLMRDPKTAFKAALAYWKSRNVNTVADKDNLRKVRQKIVGGSFGYAQSKIWHRRVKKCLKLTDMNKDVK